MIFVDTWAWLALAHKHDPYHAVCVEQHRRYQRARQRYATSDYVLSEAISLLFGRLNHVQARRFMDNLFTSIQAGRYQQVHVSSEQFELAWQLRLKYDDKPGISFVDFTSMVIMQDLGIREVFTGDHHFLHVNLGFTIAC